MVILKTPSDLRLPPPQEGNSEEQGSMGSHDGGLPLLGITAWTEPAGTIAVLTQ